MNTKSKYRFDAVKFYDVFVNLPDATQNKILSLFGDIGEEKFHDLMISPLTMEDLELIVHMPENIGYIINKLLKEVNSD